MKWMSIYLVGYVLIVAGIIGALWKTGVLEHVGGFWVLEAADLDEALAWGRKAVVACRTPVEVRAFLRIRPGGPGL